MKIAIVGTGYVGLVAGVCFADVGHRVTCVDKIPEKIDLLNKGEIPIYEPGLKELMLGAKSKLTFTTDLASAVHDNTVIFIAVGTPEKPDGSADLGPTMSVVKDICKYATEDKVIVLKSTVPIGTAKDVKSFCQEHSSYKIDIVNNPEFLKEGAAIDDFLKPDRVVIGCEGKYPQQLMTELYKPFVRTGHPILFMDNTSAEMTKYAANSFLSVKISFINELARLADKVEADISQVRKGFTSDNRISPAFFAPGVGYGGSCFPKDVTALITTGEKNNVPMQVIRAADQVNDEQKLVHFNKAKEVFGDLSKKTFAVWGLSFKPRTDDVRESPAVLLIENLVNAGAKVKAFDPAAAKTAKEYCKVDFDVSDSAMDACQDTDALFIVTDWNEFNNPNYAMIKETMKSPIVFDGRNICAPEKMKDLGFEYYSIGRMRVS